MVRICSSRTVFARGGRLAALVVVLAGAAAAEARADFSFNLNLTGFSDSQQAVFERAASMWETVILGYQPGITYSGITITGAVENLGGVNGTLATTGITSTRRRAGFTLSRSGKITVDSADISALEVHDNLLPVLEHEIGHILGIGSLWVANGLYVNDSGEYTGEYGLAAYQAEFDANAQFIPVELGGGAGTANVHWDETYAVRNGDGVPLASELMTGYFSGSNFLSNTTVQSLRDLGFDVVESIPLPPVLGDLDGNGVFDAFDTTAFELALADRTSYLSLYPDSDPDVVGDFNGDGVLNAFDVSGFEQSLAGGKVPVPEPAALTTFLFACVAIRSRPRR